MMAISSNAFVLLASIFYLSYGQEYEFGLATAIDFVSCVENGQPIPTSYRCDGIEDCPSGTDEEDCGSSSSIELECLLTEFECSPGECINLAFKCDGINHCANGKDEAGCRGRSNCNAGEFQCGDGTCINATLHCDDVSHCADNSDEIDCRCGASTFKCSDPDSSHVQCIPSNYVCDGEPDCDNENDELNCEAIQDTCGIGEFQCKDGRCLVASLVCDSNDDCDDGSDEDKSYTNCYHLNCGDPSLYFTCPTLCIHSLLVCDGYFDCVDGTDELNCEQKDCKSNQYQCLSGACVRMNKVCDGNEDCEDSSDEFFCPEPEGVVCEDDEFPCYDGLQCINDLSRCDGIPQCDDGSDEKHCNSSMVCDESCEECRDSNYCRCSGHGYHINPNDGRSCVDINECEAGHKCSHSCVNTDGGYNCTCAPGYYTVDGTNCVAHGAHDILFTNYYDIQKLTLNEDRLKVVKSETVVDSVKNVAGIDYHYQLQYMFWIDLSKPAIMRAFMNGSNSTPIVTKAIARPGGISVDWLNNHIYWTDSVKKRVEVATLDGTKRSVVVSTKEVPQDIVVDPINRKIYWVEISTKRASSEIKMSSLDGSSHATFITKDLHLKYVSGLRIDQPSETLYWTDPITQTIRSSHLSGGQFSKTVTTNVTKPSSMEVFENRVYWIESEINAIYSVDKLTGRDFAVIQSSLFKPVDFTIVHEVKQPQGSSINPCSINNGGCQYMCVPTATSHKCMCPPSSTLLDDEKTCSQYGKFILYSAKDSLWIYPLDIDEAFDVSLPVRTFPYSNIVDMAWYQNYIYWVDASVGSINRATISGSNQTVVVDTGISQPTGVAVDWLAQKLYWIDTDTRRICASELDGSRHVMLVQEDSGSLTNLVVHPKLGLMFWGVSNVKRPHIKRANLDGSNVQLIDFGNEAVGNPLSLALDYSTDRLYWIDVSKTTMKSAFIDGTDFETVTEADELSGTRGIAVYGDYVYWTDTTTGRILRVNKKPPYLTDTVTVYNKMGLQGITVYHTEREQLEVPHPCTVDNGGCEWFCVSKISSDDSLVGVCKCPVGFRLLNNKNCANYINEYIIVARDSALMRVSLDSHSDIQVTIPILPPPNNPLSVSVDLKENDIYWIEGDTICRVHYLGGNKEVVVKGLVRPTALAVDWIARNLYWADSATHRIEVSHLNGSDRLVLMEKDEVSDVTSIALDFKSHHMYWSSTDHVYEAFMDGSNVNTIIGSPDVSHPVSIAIDSFNTINNILYVVDTDRKCILQYLLQAENPPSNFLRVTTTEYPIGLATNARYLYYVDRTTGTLYSVAKSASNDRIKRIQIGLSHVTDMTIARRDNWIQRGDLRYPCDETSDCQSLCLANLELDYHSCNCPTGIELNQDGQSCPSVPSIYLLFSTGSSLRRISQDTPKFYDVPILLDLQHVTHIDYHLNSATTGFFYWLDSQEGAIMRSDIYGGNVETFITGLTQPAGLSIDWTSGSIYYISGGQIFVASPNGQYRKTLVSNHQTRHPKNVVIHPSLGLMFWTNLGTDNSSRQIVSARLDNLDHARIIANDGLQDPTQLALDMEDEWLYWTDQEKGIIEKIKFNGISRGQVISVDRPFGVALYGNVMFWGDKNSKNIFRADKYIRIPTTLYSDDGAGSPWGMTVVSTDRNGEINGNTSASSCAYDNGGCQYICIPYAGRTRKCACPMDFNGYCEERVGDAPEPPIHVPDSIVSSVTRALPKPTSSRYSTTLAPKTTETPQDLDDRENYSETSKSYDDNSNTLAYALSPLAAVIVILILVLILIIFMVRNRTTSTNTAAPIMVHNKLFRENSSKEVTAKALGCTPSSLPSSKLPKTQLNNTSDVHKTRKKAAPTNRLSLTKIHNTDQQVHEKSEDFDGPEEFVVTPVQSRRQCSSLTTPPTSPKSNTFPGSDEDTTPAPPLPEKPRKILSPLPLPQTPAKLALTSLDAAEPTVKSVKFDVEEPPPLPPRACESHAGPPLSPPPVSARSLCYQMSQSSSLFYSDSDLNTDGDIFTDDDDDDDAFNSSTDIPSDSISCGSDNVLTDDPFNSSTDAPSDEEQQ